MNKQINYSILVSGNEIHSISLAIEVVVNFIGWCNYVIEDLDGNISTCTDEKQLINSSEVFIYKNKMAYNSWQKHSCTTKNNQDMIHIVKDSSEFFLTYGVNSEL